MSQNCPDNKKEAQDEAKKDKSFTGQPDVDPRTLEEGQGDEIVDRSAAKKEKDEPKEEENKKKQRNKPRRIVNF